MHFHVKSMEIKKQYKSLFKLRVAHMCYSQIKERLICVTLRLKKDLYTKLFL